MLIKLTLVMQQYKKGERKFFRWIANDIELKCGFKQWNKEH